MQSLRSEIPPVPDIKDVMEKMQRLPDISALFLYTREGYELMKELCLLFSSTPPSPVINGWQEFGHELGVDSVILEVRNLER